MGANIDEETLVADKVPTLILPAATKTPFYRNRLLAAQWVQASKALRQADELILMGYSAPPTDLTVSTLITTQFNGDAIIPVNQDPAVIDRAGKLGSKVKPPEVVDEFVATDAIDRWVATFASDTSGS